MSLDTSERDIARLEMLSDGVLAIAITLLGLELKERSPSRRPEGVIALETDV